MAALGDHDGVDHEVEDLLGFQHLCDGLDDGGRRQHAGLDRRNLKIVKDGVDLSGDHRRRQLKDVRDLFRVLGSDGRDDRHRKHAVGGHGLDVGLNACAPTGIRTGNGQHLLEGRRHGGECRPLCGKVSIYIRCGGSLSSVGARPISISKISTSLSSRCLTGGVQRAPKYSNLSSLLLTYGRYSCSFSGASVPVRRLACRFGVPHLPNECGSLKRTGCAVRGCIHATHRMQQVAQPEQA